MSRSAMAIVLAGVTLAISGCGANSSSQPQGVTFASISKAMKNSNMKNAHFSVVGNIVLNGSRYPIQGDGVLQRMPAPAIETNLTLLSYTAAGDIQIQQIQIGGRTYSKVGNGAWTWAPDTSTISPLTPTGYAGEDSRDGQPVWHMRASDATGLYDMWVRETDAYIVLVSYKDPVGDSFNFIMNSYNKSQVITAP